MTQLPFLSMRTGGVGETRALLSGLDDGASESDVLGLGLRRRNRNISAPACPPPEVNRGQLPYWARPQRMATAAALAFGLAIVGCAFSGIWCIQFMARATERVAGYSIPKGADCLRVYRSADYVTTTILTGTPLAEVEVLVRFDKVSLDDTGLTNLRLFSSRIAESHSVSCAGSLCQDVAIMQLAGPNEKMTRTVINFEYTNPIQEAIAGSTAVSLGLGGELYLAPGQDYYLTATHLCYDALTASLSDLESESEGVALVASVDAQGLLRTNAADIPKVAPFLESPVYKAYAEEHCSNLVNVALFPGQASQEELWLGLGSTRLYEFSGSGIAKRRAVVEVGRTCAATHSEYERAYSLFELDCQAYTVPCETYPTIPFRRMARSQMRIAVSNTNGALVWAEEDARLNALPKFSETDDAVWLSVLKLLVMLLTAGIVWIRSAKTSSSAAWLYLHSLRAALGSVAGSAEEDEKNETEQDKKDKKDEDKEDKENKEEEDRVSSMEDAVIGLVAIGARYGIAQWRIVSLTLDGNERVCISELVAAGASLVHWCLRYLVLARDLEYPLTKIGGSTAVVDASCAVMLAFSEPPLLVSSVGRFDPTARLLTALLISLTTWHRCIYASASCAVRWAAARDNPACGPAYAFVAFLGTLLWVMQSVSVGIVLSDSFAVPSAFSMARAEAGNFVYVAQAIFLTILVAGMPQLLRTSRSILELKL